MKKRHQLRIVGITYNQIESGVYAVILEEVKGDRRIPIVIGYPEAQAIECRLQQINTPRPLTHDLLKTVLDTFNLRLACIEIHKLPSGVFAANLIMEGPDGELHKIDSRSSDALALAIRTGSPIFTDSEVLDECGFRPKPAEDVPSDANAEESDPLAAAEKMLKELPKVKSEVDSLEGLEQFLGDADADTEDADAEVMEFLSNYSDKEIENLIAKFARDEKYESAARLKRLLQRRRGE